MNIDKKIYIGADHAGFALKEEIKKYFDSENLSYEDMGNVIHDTEDDYPDFAFAVARRVAADDGFGILLCHNGVGVCVAANKVKGIRAVNTDSVDIARESKNDDHTNVLCLPGEYVNIEKAKEIIAIWLESSFGEDDRYQRRIDKIIEIENL